MRTNMKGLVLKDGKPRLWTGVPVGVGVTWLATKVMPDFAEIENQYLYPLPYALPGLLVGGLLALSPKYRKLGWGTIIGSAGYYAQALFFNLGAVNQAKVQQEAFDRQAGLTGAGGVQILGTIVPRPVPPRRAAPRR